MAKEINRENAFEIILNNVATISSSQILWILHKAGYTEEELKKDFRFSDADIAECIAQSA